MARVLVVDGDPANRRWIASILGGAAHEVVEAGTRRAAYIAIANHEIDLILVDAGLPGGDPLDLCRGLRDDAKTADVPLILVTTLEQRDLRIEAIDAGFDELLMRPIDDVELVVRVRGLLRARDDRAARDRQRQLASAILDVMDEGVVVADGRTGYTLVNRAAQRMLGATASWPSPSHWPRRGEVAAPLARALGGEAQVEAQMILPDKRRLHVNARPLPVIAGHAPAALAVFRDVTRLAVLDQFKADMTSYVVHDLKNAMLVINANLEFSLEGELPEDAREPMIDARDACDRACRLIANLMDVNKLEDSRLRVNARPVELAAAVSSLVSSRASQLRARGIDIEADLESAPRVRADHEILQRVIDNILDNAVRYTPDGGRIVLSATPTADTVRLKIGNTGNPIPLEHRAAIFDKYQRLGTANQHNAGLGLHFCRLAVAAHQGRIWVDSTEELPALFVIELPIADGLALGTNPRRVRTPSLAALLRYE